MSERRFAEISGGYLDYVQSGPSQINPTIGYAVNHFSYNYNNINAPKVNEMASSSIATPHLNIIEQPTNKPFRFRFATELQGKAWHGSLTGASTRKHQRTFPSVSVVNYNSSSKVYIYCSLYQVPREGSLQRNPHSHKLFIGKNGSDALDPHVVEVSHQNNFTATFQNMGIIHTLMKEIKEVLFQKMCNQRQLELKRQLTQQEVADIHNDATLSKKMNLNKVCLRFDAYDACTMERICEPVYSNVINNKKGPEGDLRIIRMSQYTSPVSGGLDLLIFVEKVCRKNIKVKFFKLNDDGTSHWESFGIFGEADVHHQFGIALQTPPYGGDITGSVDVMVQLFRPSDGATSESVAFRYKSPHQVPEETPRIDSQVLAINLVESPNSSMQGSSNGSFRDQSSSHHQPDDDINQILSDIDIDMLDYSEIPISDYFGTFTASGLNFECDDLEGMHNVEHSSSYVGVSAETLLETDSVSVANFKPKTSSLSEKLRALLGHFKNHADEKKLRGMVATLFHQKLKYGRSTLLELVLHEPVESIRDLIIIMAENKMATPQAVNKAGQSCIHLLVAGGYTRLLKLFLSLGVCANQVDAQGDSPLHLAVGEDDEESVKVLIEGSEDLELNQLNDSGFSPLHLAVSRSNLAIVQRIVKGGADLYKKVPQSGNNALHLAVSSPSLSMSIIAYLIGCDENLVHEENNSWMNVLEVAASYKQPGNLIEYLSDFYDEYFSFESEAEADSSSGSEEEKCSSPLFDPECLDTLCEIFDSENYWKKLLIVGDQVHKIDRFQHEASPSRKLFLHFEREGKTIDDLKEIFDLLDDEEAAAAVDELVARTMLK